MNRSLLLTGLASVLALVVGCGAEPSSASEEDAQSSEIGIANPAAVHCQELGHTPSGDDCVFPDGTRCEQWAFYRGECSAPAPKPVKPTKDPSPACTPLPPPSSGGAMGVANPAAVYCDALGYTTSGEDCVFADGTRCEQWSFYRGECGHAHSFCNKNGGTVSNVQEDMGGWTASYAVCTLPSGASCAESVFAQSCGCP